MITAAIGATDWLVWALIGVIGGYMAGRLLTSGGMALALRVIIGIAAAIGGGYAFLMWFGENDYGQTISLVGSVVVCGIVLWLISLIFRSPDTPEDE